jgi:SAM-dependent methyltransferase
MDVANEKVDSKFVFGLPEEGKTVFQHPWKLSRGNCVLKQLRHKNLHNVADIGVNDMYYTKKAKEFADGKIYAVDVFFPENGETRDGIFCINDIKKLPDNELDRIIMMDVLEHIENDKIFFDVIVNKLKNGGIMLITVPAWQFLFSAHDVKSLHYRRYNRKQLLALLKHNEIKTEKCHYFYTSLFLARLAFISKKDKFGGNDIGWKYSEKNIMTIIVKTVLDIDFWINKILDKIGVHLPGLSLIAVCRKNI